MRYPLFHEVSRTRVRELQSFAVKMEVAGATRGKVPCGPYRARLPPLDVCCQVHAHNSLMRP
jgi:hypothetical protein